MIFRRDLLGGGLAFAVGLANADRPSAMPRWQVLPPTPAAPRYGLERHDDVNGAMLWSGHFGGGTMHPPILLLHGGFANSDYFGWIAPRLARTKRRVIALDTRGHGRSTRSSERFSYSLLAADVAALMDRWAVPTVDIVGWSDGGNTGLMLALDQPHRVNRLFCFGANANRDGLNPDYASKATFQAYLERVEIEYRRLSPTPNEFGSFSQQIAQMWDQEPNLTAADLKRISCPVEVAIAAHDEAISQPHARYMAATIPEARLRVLPGVSHFAMLQDPAGFYAAIQAFLAT